MLNIFQSARIKLTLWYLLIIATISSVFSMVIYQGIVREIEQGYQRVENRYFDENLFIMPRQEVHNAIIAQNIKQTKQRVRVLLFYANSIILVASGAVAYYLAGQSLEPIARAMSEQKRFIEDASHELKTPLTALKTNTEVALRSKHISKDDAITVLKENLIAVNTLQTLTEDMLRLSRYRKSAMGVTKVDIPTVLKKVTRSLMPLARQKHITIHTSYSPLTVSSRASDLEKLFSTILDNAIAYTPNNGSVTVTTRKHLRNGEIRVVDTGIGIAKQDLPHIFKRFYRADLARTRKEHNGYGLGLPIARQIAEQYNGTIMVKSKEGKGTEVKITFPLV